MKEKHLDNNVSLDIEILSKQLEARLKNFSYGRVKICSLLK